VRPEEQSLRSSGRPETPAERADRNLSELLGELRVALPGVQVLFAFLLVVPFNQRFVAATAFERLLYFATLLLTASAAVLLIAPSFHHRVLFRRQQKERIVLVGNRLAIVGLTLMALAISGVVLLVTDFLFGTVAGAVTTALLAVLIAVVWYVLPRRTAVPSGAGPDGGQQREHDGRAAERTVTEHHERRQPGLGRRLAAGCGGQAEPPAPQPACEHAEAEQCHGQEADDGDPGEGAGAAQQVDRPDHEAAHRQRQVAVHDGPGEVGGGQAELLLHAGLLGDALGQPVDEQEEAERRGDEPGRERDQTERHRPVLRRPAAGRAE
jgi:hypothetical protein